MPTKATLSQERREEKEKKQSIYITECAKICELGSGKGKEGAAALGHRPSRIQVACPNSGCTPITDVLHRLPQKVDVKM